MRRLAIVLFIAAAACSREQPAPQPSTAAPSTAEKRATAPAAQPAFPRPNRSTPDRCAGDGSYAQAVECFRSTSRLDFAIEEPKGIRAEGEMTRSTPGAESEHFRLQGTGSSDGEWSAVAKATGVSWTRGGQHVPNEPAIVDRVWQRTTMYIDPQKKEGEPQKTGNEAVAGEDCIRYRFTDANNGDVHDVWVSARDGHFVQIQVESHGAFPSYTMKIAKAGK